MFERFSDGARRAVVLAQEECARLGHRRIGAEHLLLGVAAVEEGAGAKALADVGSGLPALRRTILELQPAGATAPAGHIPFTGSAKKAMERSLHEAERRQSTGISSGHILLALLHDADAEVRRTLDAAGVDAGALAAAAGARLGEEPAGPSDRGTGAEPDRLDRIEAALAGISARLDRIERLLGGESAAQG